MKRYKIQYILLFVTWTFTAVSCSDFLDLEPPSYVVPEDYYQSEDQVQAAVNQFYTDVLPSHNQWGYGTFETDNHTDNQAGFSADNKYGTGLWLVGTTNNNWTWTNIRNINYTLNTVLGYYENDGISGSDTNIRHYIGELYFFRAYCYFNMLQKWGDLPIIKEALGNDEAVLVENNKRSPRNEVARFILEDLATAANYMATDIDSRRNLGEKNILAVFFHKYIKILQKRKQPLLLSILATAMTANAKLRTRPAIPVAIPDFKYSLNAYSGHPATRTAVSGRSPLRK